MTRSEPALGAFGVCWGAAIAFSIVSAPKLFVELSSAGSSPDLAASVAAGVLAVIAVLRPARPTLLAVSLALLVEVGIALPEVPNHRWILGLGSIAILPAILTTGRDRGFETLVPAARALVVIVYAFAFFAKLNRDFVDPLSSCAAQFNGELARWWSFWPTGAAPENAAIVATLAVESLLPVLLCLRSTRRGAVLLGIAFHLVLGLDVGRNLLNFSSVMIALLLTFLPMPFFASFAAKLDREPALRRALAASLVLIFVTGLCAVTDWSRFAILYYWIRQLVWMTYALVILGAAAGWHGATLALPMSLRAVAIALVVGIFAVANGLSPYLGIKTRTAFDMYSNLRMEADRSNHWIVPHGVDLLGTAGEPPWMKRLRTFRPVGEESRSLCVW